MRRPRAAVGSSTGPGARSTRNGWAASKASAALVRRGEHGGALGGEPAPQLPQVRLDAAELGREVVGDEQVLHPAAPRAARRSRAQRACSASRSSSPARRTGETGERPRDRRGSADVAEGHQGVAAQVAGVAVGDVPAAVAGQQLVVGRVEQVEQVDPGRGRRHRPRAALAAAAAVRRADLLAVVAAVDPVAQGHPVLDGERPRRPAPARPGSGGRRPRRGRRWRPVGQPSRQRRHAAAAVGDRLSVDRAARRR